MSRKKSNPKTLPVQPVDDAKIKELERRYRNLEKKYRHLLLQNVAMFDKDFQPIEIIIFGKN